MRKYKWLSSSCCSAILILTQAWPTISQTHYEVQVISQSYRLERTQNQVVDKNKRSVNYKMLEQRLFQTRQIYCSA
jgi:hypothetical protein